VDGLDIPLISQLDAGFFEYGSTTLATTATPAVSNSERLWGHAGLRPVSAPVRPNSPLMAYRWADTDAALRDQLALEAEGQPGTVEPGHAAVRFYNPTTGGDALRTIRLEMHRFAAGTATATTQVVGSAVWTVFEGTGTVTVGEANWTVSKGDVFAVPSWAPVTIAADAELDVFRFSDDPVYEAFGLDKTERAQR
jgi:gentisate 1,2-dioxygenase